MSDITVNGTHPSHAPQFSEGAEQGQPVRFWLNAMLRQYNTELPPGEILGPDLIPRFAKCPKVQIGDYSIPVLNGLTAAEVIFAEFLTVRLANKSGEFRSAINQFTKALQSAFPAEFPNRQKASEAAYSILNGQGGAEYDDFLDAQADLVARIFDLSNRAISTQTQDLMLACFLLAHRVDPNIVVSDLYSLTGGELTAIGNLWRKEANNGVEPEPVATPQTTADNPIEEAIIEAEAAEVGVEAEPSAGEQTEVVPAA
jgi:hypothetical protein